MKIIDEVMTTAEAAERWGISAKARSSASPVAHG